MGRNSAGVKAGTNDGGGQYKGKISRVGSLVEMKDKAIYKATESILTRERRMFQESTPRITRADGVRAQISLLPIR